MGSPGLIMLLIQKTAWIVPCWCVVTVGMAFIDGSANPELADIGEQRHPGSYGKIYAISTTGTGIGFVIGPLIGAALLKHGFQVTWICFGAALVAASVFVSLGFVSFVSSGNMLTGNDIRFEEEYSCIRSSKSCGR
jgi:MFS family permease